MSLIGNPDTPESYVADYMQACVGMFGIPAGGFTSDIETYGAATSYDVESLYAAMLNSTIGRSIYAPGISNESFATKLVDKVGGGLLSDANKAAAIDEVQALLDGGLSRAATAMAVVEFVAGLETSDETYGAVAQQFQNRIEIANYYTFSSTNPSSTLSTLTAVLSGVSNTTDVSDPEEVINDSTEPGVSTGQTYTLTTSIDNVTGTTGNDTIIGDNTGTASTISSGDQINGGSGTDTVKLYFKTDASAGNGLDEAVLPTMSNVESLHIIGTDLTTTATRDFSTLAGVTSVTVESPKAFANTESFTIKTGSGQTVALTGVNVATGGAATLTLDGASKLTANALGTDTTNNGTLTVDVKSATATSFDLVTSTAASKFTLTNTGANMATLNVSGDKNATLTTTLATLKTINAGSATGAVALDVSGVGTLASAFAFTGGSGNDTLTLGAGDLGDISAGSQLNGGSGTGDKLVTKETAALTAAQIAKVNATTGFEVLGFGASGSGVDVSKLTSINEFYVGQGDFTTDITNATNSTKVNIDLKAGNTGTVTIANTVGDTSTTVALDNQAGASKTLAALTLTGITTVALSSSGKTGDTNVITTLTNADNSAITITGGTDLTITNALAGTSTGSKVDASAFTGKLTVTGSGKADVLIGGSAGDTLISGTGGDKLTGNGGADTFDVKTAVYGAGKEITNITDFVAKTDTIKLDDQGTETFTAAKVDTSAASSLAAALGLIATGVNGSANAAVKWGQYDGNTYIVQIRTDNSSGVTDAAVTDIVVKLTGAIDLSTFTVSDFAFA